MALSKYRRYFQYSSLGFSVMVCLLLVGSGLIEGTEDPVLRPPGAGAAERRAVLATADENGMIGWDSVAAGFALDDGFEYGDGAHAVSLPD
jgi:hypothetical protein